MFISGTIPKQNFALLPSSSPARGDVVGVSKNQSEIKTQEELFCYLARGDCSPGNLTKKPMTEETVEKRFQEKVDDYRSIDKIDDYRSVKKQGKGFQSIGSKMLDVIDIRNLMNEFGQGYAQNCFIPPASASPPYVAPILCQFENTNGRKSLLATISNTSKLSSALMPMEEYVHDLFERMRKSSKNKNGNEAGIDYDTFHSFMQAYEGKFQNK
jgi:hypothetical protein